MSVVGDSPQPTAPDDVVTFTKTTVELHGDESSSPGAANSIGSTVWIFMERSTPPAHMTALAGRRFAPGSRPIARRSAGRGRGPRARRPLRGARRPPPELWPRPES